MSRKANIERLLMLTYLCRREPPVPFTEEWVGPCLDACYAWREGRFDERIRLPGGVIHPDTGIPYASAYEVVERFELERTTFVW